jgi:DNA-binding MarR family transcriptional regulator
VEVTENGDRPATVTGFRAGSPVWRRPDVGLSLGDLPGYQVLSAAVGEPPRNQGAIGADLGIDRTILTYLIDDLERAELVARRPDPADRRSRLVVATTKGRETWQTRRDSLQHVEAHVLGALAPTDAESFRGLLQTIACSAQSLDPLTDLCEAVAAARGGGAARGEDPGRGGSAARGDDPGREGSPAAPARAGTPGRRRRGR